MGTVAEKFGYNGSDPKYIGMFMAMRDWADELGISRSTVRHRLKNGMPIDEARRNAEGVEYNGSDPKYIGQVRRQHEWAKEFGLNKSTVYSRFSAGIPIDKEVAPRIPYPSMEPYGVDELTQSWLTRPGPELDEQDLWPELTAQGGVVWREEIQVL